MACQKNYPPPTGEKSPIQLYDDQSEGLARWARKSRSALELVQDLPNHHHQSASPSSSITLVNLALFSSFRKLNSDIFCLFGKSNPTSGSKVTDYRKLVRRAPKAVFGRISCISKVYFCISCVFDHLWRPGSVCWFKMAHWKANLEICGQGYGCGEWFDTYIPNCIWVVFGLYFLYFRTVFLYAWPHGWSGLDLKFPKITSESEIGGLSHKLRTFKVKQETIIFASNQA